MSSPFKQKGKGKPPAKPPAKAPKTKMQKALSDQKGERVDYSVDVKKAETGITADVKASVSTKNAASKKAIIGRGRSGSASKNALSIAKNTDLDSLYE